MPYIIQTGAVVPTLQARGNWKITMYPADHNPPHFHVILRSGERASVNILNFEVHGNIPVRHLRAPLAWAAANRAFLIRKCRCKDEKDPMLQALPTLVKVEAAGNHILRVKFRREGWQTVRLDGLIARFAALKPLRDEKLFAKAKIVDWGAAIGWTDDIAISADTLLRLAREQSPFSHEDFVSWQERVKLSNQEAADALGVSLSTIKNLRAGVAPVGNAVAIACRAMEAEPVTLAAHLRPRKTGRPRAA